MTSKPSKPTGIPKNIASLMDHLDDYARAQVQNALKKRKCGNNDEAAVSRKRKDIFGEPTLRTQDDAVKHRQEIRLAQKAVTAAKNALQATNLRPEPKPRAKKAKTQGETSSGSPPPSDASENGAQEDDSSSDSDGED